VPPTEDAVPETAGPTGAGTSPATAATVEVVLLTAPATLLAVPDTALASPLGDVVVGAGVVTVGFDEAVVGVPVPVLGVVPALPEPLWPPPWPDVGPGLDVAAGVVAVAAGCVARAWWGVDAGCVPEAVEACDGREVVGLTDRVLAASAAASLSLVAETPPPAPDIDGPAMI
jgi:hypothetical protein